MTEKVAMDNVKECSSYGTDYSEQEEMERTTREELDNMGKAMKTLQASIEAINVVQAVVKDKLASLEKVVLTVQFDMTWVRGDMRGVHNVMEKLVDHVCELRDATVEVERLREQVQANDGAQQTYKGKGHMEGSLESPNARSGHGELGGRDDYEQSPDPTYYEPGSYIEETQRLDNNVEMHINYGSPTEEDKVDDYGYVREASLGLCSPPRKQTKNHIGAEDVLDLSQRMEMSCPNTQPRTTASGQSMWKDFVAAVRDWPTPTRAMNGSGSGRVSAKRGRRSTQDCSQERLTQGKESQMREHATLNLNLSPDKHVPMEGRREKRDIATGKGIDGTLKYGA